LKKVLIVDDDLYVRKFISGVLEKEENFEVVAIDRADSILEIIEKEKIDIVLLDISLPGIDGLSALNKVKQKYPHIEVIMMTADPTDEKLVSALKGNAFSFFIKPIETRKLIKYIKQASSRLRSTEKIEVISAKPDFIEIVIPTHMEYVHRLRTFFLNIETGLTELENELIGFAFSEMLENAIEHGNRNDINKRIRITFNKFKGFIMYRIRDDGQGFRLDNLANTVRTKEITDLINTEVDREKAGVRPGGLGIYSVKSIMDEILYNEKCNEVILVKYIKKCW